MSDYPKVTEHGPMWLVQVDADDPGAYLLDADVPLLALLHRDAERHAQRLFALLTDRMRAAQAIEPAVPLPSPMPPPLGWQPRPVVDVEQPPVPTVIVDVELPESWQLHDDPHEPSAATQLAVESQWVQSHAASVAAVEQAMTSPEPSPSFMDGTALVLTEHDQVAVTEPARDVTVYTPDGAQGVTLCSSCWHLWSRHGEDGCTFTDCPCPGTDVS